MMKKTNREVLNTRLAYCSAELRQELEHYLELESVSDDADALDDYIEFIEPNEERRLWAEIKSILIEVGYVEPIDIKSVVQVGRGPKYWFIDGGQHYDTVDGFKRWLEKQPLSS